MKELIVIESRKIGAFTIPTANARDLHEFLESKQDFSDWIKGKIKRYGFAEGVDFITFHNSMEKGLKPKTEYYLTLDMAKELAMVERNARGKDARQYFLECEAVALSRPTPVLPVLSKLQIAKQLVVELERNETLELKILSDAPKVEFYDTVVNDKDLLAVDETAKKLSINLPLKKKIGTNRLFAFLRQLGWYMKARNKHNRPTQMALTLGFMDVRINAPTEKYPHETTTPLVTGKGFKMIAAKLAEAILDGRFDICLKADKIERAAGATA